MTYSLQQYYDEEAMDKYLRFIRYSDTCKVCMEPIAILWRLSYRSDYAWCTVGNMVEANSRINVSPKVS